jgi:hypothetical protein
VPVYAVKSKFRTLNAATKVHDLLAINNVGKGTAIYAGFLPGLSYFGPAIPKEPVDRGSTDQSMDHFIPTKFNKDVAEFIGGWANTVQKPVTCSERLVESCVIEAKTGVAIPLINWTGGPLRGLEVSLNIDVPDRQVSLASGNPVKMEKKDGRPVFTFDLDVADALILR